MENAMVAQMHTGTSFRLIGDKAFHKTRASGTARTVREMIDNEDGTYTVVTTDCGESYTFPADQSVTVLCW